METFWGAFAVAFVQLVLAGTAVMVALTGFSILVWRTRRKWIIRRRQPADAGVAVRPPTGAPADRP